jgi:hypothetical protein
MIVIILNASGIVVLSILGAEREENIWGPLDTECIV